MYCVSTPTLESRVSKKCHKDVSGALKQVFGTDWHSVRNITAYVQALTNGKPVTYGCVGKVYTITPEVS